MPWPFVMAQDCLDPVYHSPRTWPWPTKDWRFNAPSLRTMQFAMTVYDLVTKEGKWSHADDELYKMIHTETKA